ncbi:MAG: sigma 54-interacting transcriptional regulator [Myxococcota bacterium]
MTRQSNMLERIMESQYDRSSVGRVLVISTQSSEKLQCQDNSLSFRHATSVQDGLLATASWAPHLVLIDSQITNLGPELVRTLRDTHSCVCALLVQEPSGEGISLALRCDADTAIPWPLEPVSLRRVMTRRSTQPRSSNPDKWIEPASFVVGESAEMREVWRKALLVAQTEASVLIHGETGTGKEVIARAVHRFSSRRDGPFVPVHCAALPESLLESELFGHEKGAFTGATSRRIGRFELAQGGTLFLDEIGDVPPALQVKLLRVLQERSFERLGGTEPIAADIRLVSATHHDLSELCKKQRFRSDLFYRLNVVAMDVPPLRKRRSDVLLLWDRLLEDGAQRDQRPTPHTPVATKRLLLKHEWPGNVRELQNIVQHVLTVSTGSRVDPTDLPSSLHKYEGEVIHTPPSLVGLTVKEAERILILQAYEALGTVNAVAEMLDLSPRTIHYRLNTYKKQGWRGIRRGTASANTSVSTPQKMRVLLAEDDDEFRWALADYLKSQGYEVLAVADGTLALEHLTKSTSDGAWPHIIVTDMRMPGVTGAELLQDLRNRGLDTPVVLMSAFGDTDMRSHAESLGASAFLDKPVELKQLQNAMQQALH